MADNTLQKEVDHLKEEFRQLRKEMGSLVSEVKNRGRSAAHTTKTKAEQELDEMLEKLNRAYLSARKTGEQAATSLQHEIKQHPVASAGIVFLGIAFLVGIATGKFFSQK